MKIWIGFRMSTGEEFAETSETTLKAKIKEMAMPGEQWMIRQIETHDFKAPRVAEMISSLKPGQPSSMPFIKTVLTEYELLLTEGGRLQKYEE